MEGIEFSGTESGKLPGTRVFDTDKERYHGHENAFEARLARDAWQADAHQADRDVRNAHWQGEIARDAMGQTSIESSNARYENVKNSKEDALNNAYQSEKTRHAVYETSNQQRNDHFFGFYDAEKTRRQIDKENCVNAALNTASIKNAVDERFHATQRLISEDGQKTRELISCLHEKNQQEKLCDAKNEITLLKLKLGIV